MSSELLPGWRATTCPRCNGPFACGVGADRAKACFCAGVPLRAERLVELRARWADCLCEACLRTLADHPELPA
jgi:hypothetical protein